MSSPLFRPAATWPVRGSYDVVVVGAGPGGLGAAIAAGRLGARTLLIERYGFAGGVATAACCPYLMGFGAEWRQIIGGIADDLVRALARDGAAAFNHYEGPSPDPVPIGDRPLVENVLIGMEGFKRVAAGMLEEAGVTRLFYTTCLGAVVEDRRITALAIDNVDGPALIGARTVVDATGDAQVVWRAGGETRAYDPAQAMSKTILLRVGGVRGFDRQTVAQRFKEVHAAGRVPLMEQNVFMGVPLLNPGEVLLNFTMTAGDALQADELVRMDDALRAQIPLAMDFYRREFPEFADCFLVDAAVHLGVRAGRGIVGRETITMEAIDADLPVAEPIALGTRSYGGHSLRQFDPPWRKAQPGIRPIPRGALLSASFDNVAAAGRGISCDPRVMDTFRLMARCLALGHAAGVNAALAARADGSLAAVPYPVVREALLAQGAILA